MSVVGVFVLNAGVHLPFKLVESDSFFGAQINLFQSQNPFWAASLSSLMIFLSVRKLARVVSTQNIFGVTSSIHLPIIGVLLWAVTLSESYLLTALVATLSSVVVGGFVLSVRGSEHYAALFNASLTLSLLSLLYAPALVMLALAPTAMFILRATLREWIVTVFGLLLPISLVAYIYWLGGADFTYVYSCVAQGFVSHSHLLDFRILLLFRTVIVALALLLSLISIAWFKSNNAFKARARLQIIASTVIISLLTLLAPSASLLSFALVAPAVAILASFTMVHLRGRVANVLYFIFLTLLVLAMFTPLYLPL